MKRIMSICLCFLFMGMLPIQAEDQPPSLEEMYSTWGYTSIHKAWNEFNHHLNSEIRLPLRVPSIAFTHQFGKFEHSDSGGASFRATYVHEVHPDNHYNLDIRSSEEIIEFSDRQLIETFSLKDGTEAHYISLPEPDPSFFALVFMKDDLQYILSLDQRISDSVTPYELLDIANSLEPTK